MSLFQTTCRNCQSKNRQDLTIEIKEHTYSDLEEDYLNAISKIKDQQPQEKVLSKNTNTNIRSNMIDWIVLIKNKLLLRDETLFLSVEILDKMFFMYAGKLLNDDIHLIGLVAIYIASKYEEVRQIPIDTLLVRIGHNKFTKDDVLSTEMLILKKLRFKMPKNYFMDLLNLLMLKLKKTNELCQCYANMYSCAISLYKLSLYDIKLTNYITRFTIIHSIFLSALEKSIGSTSEKKNGVVLLLSGMGEMEIIRVKTTILSLGGSFKNLLLKENTSSFQRYENFKL